MSGRLFEIAMQVVPLLLIALFVDSPRSGDKAVARPQAWERVGERLVATLGFVAFMTSLLVVVEAVPAGGIPVAIVAAALGCSIGLLWGRIWARLATSE